MKTPHSDDNLPMRKAPASIACPPLSRRIKHWGMKAASQVASVLKRLPVPHAENEFGILIYHRVAPVQLGAAVPTLNVPPQLFRDQIVGLRKQGFQFVSLAEALRRKAAKESLPARTVVVTFDDGFESIYEFAWPTLREFGIPATIFINTAYLDQPAPFPFDAWGQAHANDVAPVSFRPLTLAQCQEMVATGLIELGAHTHTHADFRGRPDAFRRDMEMCLDSLRKNFEIESPSFAFPFGKPSSGFTENALVEIVRDLGLTCALTTEATCARLADSPYHWGRFNVYDWDTADTVAAKALGFYSWVPTLERLTPFGRRKRTPVAKSLQRAEQSADARRHALPKMRVPECPSEGA